MSFSYCLDFPLTPRSHSPSPSYSSIQSSPIHISSLSSLISSSIYSDNSSTFISPSQYQSFCFPSPSLIKRHQRKTISDKKRRKWTAEEDSLVMLLIKKYGYMWTFIASFIEGRTGKQVRERYFNQLDPKIIKRKFTPQEDEEIWILYERFGPKWLKISRFLEGRTENSVKNRFYSFLRKKTDLKKKVKKEEEGKEGEESTEGSIVF
jgi:Myb-like DNA-binding domain